MSGCFLKFFVMRRIGSDIGARGTVVLLMLRGSWQLYRQSERALVAEDTELYGFLVLTGGHLFAQLPDRPDTFAVQAGDDVADLETSFGRGRILEDTADENALPFWSAKEVTEFPIQILCVNAEPRLAEEGRGKIAKAGEGRHGGHFGHVKSESARAIGEGELMLVGLAERHAEGLGMAITPDRELRRTPSRNFANHPPKLLGAFNALTVDFGYDIIFLQSSFGRRTVRNDPAQKGASLGGKL